MPACSLRVSPTGLMPSATALSIGDAEVTVPQQDTLLTLIRNRSIFLVSREQHFRARGFNPVVHRFFTVPESQFPFKTLVALLLLLNALTSTGSLR